MCGIMRDVRIHGMRYVEWKASAEWKACDIGYGIWARGLAPDMEYGVWGASMCGIKRDTYLIAKEFGI